MPQIPEEYYEKALANGISQATLYNQAIALRAIVSHGFPRANSINLLPLRKKSMTIADAIFSL